MQADALYQEIILDHSRRPRNYGPLENATVHIEAENPLCGDELTLFLLAENGTIVRTQFTAQACAICTASASLLTNKIRRITPAQAREISARFQKLLHTPLEQEAPAVPGLGDLCALEGVRKFPMRIKCATLAWHALGQALDELEKNGPAAGSTVGEASTNLGKGA